MGDPLPVWVDNAAMERVYQALGIEREVSHIAARAEPLSRSSLS